MAWTSPDAASAPADARGDGSDHEGAQRPDGGLAAAGFDPSRPSQLPASAIRSPTIRGRCERTTADMLATINNETKCRCTGAVPLETARLSPQEGTRYTTRQEGKWRRIIARTSLGLQQQFDAGQDLTGLRKSRLKRKIGTLLVRHPKLPLAACHELADQPR